MNTESKIHIPSNILFKVWKTREKRINLSSYCFGNGMWNVYETGILSYENGLSDKFSSLPKIREFLKKTKEPIVMDLMGAGEVIRDITRNITQIDSGIAVTLVDLRPNQKKDFDKKNKIRLIEGNIYSKKTWDNIDEFLTKKDKKIDLVLCRPQGALGELPKSIDVNFALLNKIFSLLNINGMFITQLPKINFEKIAKWIEIVNTKYSDQAKVELFIPPSSDFHSHPVLKIQKISNIDTLPRS